jgi:hypothetical protein
VSSNYHTWYTDQELPGIPIAIYATDGTTLLDLTTGSLFTATVQLVRGSAIVVTQSTNITLYDGVGEGYNLTVDKWASGTLTAVVADLTVQGKTTSAYEVRPYIRRTSDSADEVPTSSKLLTVTFKTAAA